MWIDLEKNIYEIKLYIVYVMCETYTAQGKLFDTAKYWFPLSLCLLIPMLALFAYPDADYPDADPDWK